MELWSPGGRLEPQVHWMNSFVATSYLGGGIRTNAEAEGLFADRVADCGGDHPNYSGDCYPEPATGAHCGERGVRSGVDSHHQHSNDFIQLKLPDGGFCV